MLSVKHLSPEILNERRKQAVKLRLDGLSVANVCQQTGLSAPTVSAAWKAFKSGGWSAVPVATRGRAKGQAPVLAESLQQWLWKTLFSAPTAGHPGWSSAALADLMQEQRGVTLTQRAIEHWWQVEGLKHKPWPLPGLARQRSPLGRWYRHAVAPLFAALNSADQRWQGGVRRVQNPGRRVFQIYFHGARGRLWMRCFERPPQAQDYLAALQGLADRGPAALVFHGACFSASAEITRWLAQQTDFWLVPVPANAGLA